MNAKGKYRVEILDDKLALCYPDPTREKLVALMPYLEFDVKTNALRFGFMKALPFTFRVMCFDHVCRFYMDPLTDAQALTQYINDGRLDDLLDVIVSGTHTEVQGSSVKVHQTEEAYAASDAVLTVIDAFIMKDATGLVYASDWLKDADVVNEYGLSGELSDKELGAIAKRIEGNARQQTAVLVGTLDYLKGIRDGLS